MSRAPSLFIPLLVALTALLRAQGSADPLRPPGPPEVLDNLRDLRVFIDFDDDTATVAEWPRDKFGKKLPPHEIARGVRLALALWASVLPDMRFRFVNRPEEANLAVRFGPYLIAGYRHDGGMAFLPSQWSRLDATCGRRKEGVGADGDWCRETDHNMILMHSERWAVRAVDFMPWRMYGEFLGFVFDPKRPHFARGGKGPCVPLAADSVAVLSSDCVDWLKGPHFDSTLGADLAATVEHEFGHTLMGDHTPSPYDCVDMARRPPFLIDRCLRFMEDGYSSLFPGDDNGWFNYRGVFAHDVGRLRGLGYRVSYPAAAGTIVLKRRDGRTLETRDWRAAEAAMLWTKHHGVPPPALEKGMYFLVDVRPDFGAAAEGAAR